MSVARACMVWTWLMWAGVALTTGAAGCDIEPTCTDRYNECSNDCRGKGTPNEQQACLVQCENEYAGCEPERGGNTQWLTPPAKPVTHSNR